MTKKRHHYVPKAYLKAFCNDRGTILLYRKDDPAKPIVETPDGVAFHRYYYSQPLPEGGKNHDRLEDLFSELEGKWPRIVERIERRENVNDCMGDIFAFISLQRVRVPAARDASEAIMAEWVKAGMRRLDAAGKLPPKPEGYENILELVDISIDPHQSIHAMVPMMQGVGEFLRLIGVGALHNMTNTPFLTSDNPVIWFDPSVEDEVMRPYNIERDGPIVLLFPVTPKLMIYGLSSNCERFARHGIEHRGLSESKMVQEMNKQICRFAYEAVFAQGPGHEDIIRRYAELSPVVQTQAIPDKNGEFLLSQFVWGRRKRKPKWVDRDSRPGTEPGTSEPSL